MKITIWIRPGEGRTPVCRTDYKLESKDTPRIQNYGFRLIRAMTGEDLDTIKKRAGQC